MRGRVIFRVDASAEIGVGHLLRCRTLAAAMAIRNWEIGFACGPSTLQLASALTADGYNIAIMPLEVTQEPVVMRRAWPGGADALIIDHYQRDHVYEAACRPWANRVVAVDDAPKRRHNVDLLLDQTLGRSPAEYREWVSANTHIAVGSEYILLRPEIRESRIESAKVPAVARNLIVTFGSSDTYNLTARALAALGDPRLRDVSATVILGPGNPRRDALLSNAPSNARLVADPVDFAGIVARADIALTGSGTTCWELSFLGIPAVLVTDSIGNVAQSLHAAGAARWLGLQSEVIPSAMADALALLVTDAAQRHAMAKAGRNLVDGKGSERTAALIEKVICQ